MKSEETNSSSNAEPSNKSRIRPRRRALIYLLFVIVTYLTLCASLAWNTVRPKNFVLSTDPMTELNLKYVAVSWVSSGNVPIRGWLISARPGPVKGIVILAHGVDGSRLAMLQTAHMLVNSGFSCLLFDFRGRGESGRANCTIGYREVDDLVGAVNYIRTNNDLSYLPIGVLGHSQGGAVAIMAAARDNRIAAVISESPFTSLDHAIQNHFASSLGMLGRLFSPTVTMFGEFFIGCKSTEIAPVKCIESISPRPILLIEDEDDRLCPPSETQALMAVAKEPKSLWKVPGAGHIQARNVAPVEYERRITEFFTASLIHKAAK